MSSNPGAGKGLFLTKFLLKFACMIDHLSLEYVLVVEGTYDASCAYQCSQSYLHTISVLNKERTLTRNFLTHFTLSDLIVEPAINVSESSYYSKPEEPSFVQLTRLQPVDTDQQSVLGPGDYLDDPNQVRINFKPRST